MIKVLRIGHATFETPDLAKAIEHYTQVIGLSLAGARGQARVPRDQDRPARHRAAAGQRGALRQAVVRGGGGCRLRRPAPRAAEARRCSGGAQRFRSRAAQGAVVQGPQGHRDRVVPRVELSRQPRAGRRRRRAQARPRRLRHAGAEGARRVLRARCLASASPTGSATSSCSCAATPITIR